MSHNFIPQQQTAEEIIEELRADLLALAQAAELNNCGHRCVGNGKCILLRNALKRPGIAKLVANFRTTTESEDAV